MKEQLIKFKTAKLAKEKGLPHINHGLNKMYGATGNLFDSVGPGYDMTECSHAITQSLLQRWLREKHNLHILVEPHINNSIVDFTVCIMFPLKNIISGTEYNTGNNYEEALEIGLKEALKLIP